VREREREISIKELKARKRLFCFDKCLFVVDFFLCFFFYQYKGA
jgi:hypothetical protein